MKNKVTSREAFLIAEKIFTILRDLEVEGVGIHEVKALLHFEFFKTNNLMEIKEIVRKDFYHIPKKILEVKIARTLKSLLDGGFVIKEKLPEDKRQALIFISPKGEKVIKEIHEMMDKKWKELEND